MTEVTLLRPSPRRATISTFTVVVALAAIAGCSDPAEPGPGAPREESWSFETGMEGWAFASSDIHPGGWVWAHPSTALASDGAQSIQIFIDNRTGTAKVWIVRQFSVQPNRDHMVQLSFDFASADSGDGDQFQLLAGVSPTAPATGAEVLAVARTNIGTGNGEVPQYAGYLWSQRLFTRSTRSSADGKLYVLLGVWGTWEEWETANTFFVDNVWVEITPL